MFKKPTKVFGLRTPWLSRLARRCPGHHAHVRLKGSWTARAAKYVPALVEVWAAEAARAFHSTFADLADEDVLAATPEDAGASESLWINELIGGLDFSSHFCVPVPTSQHINVRELQAQAQLLRSIATSGQWPCRALGALDSLVTRGVVKGPLGLQDPQ